MLLFGDVSDGIGDPMLALAATAAAEASGRTAPNPLVGAVVVDTRGDVVAVAHHRRAGEPHAEALALREAGERARGGVLYVTLEPCAHHGRTPPCTDAVLASGVARVVIGMPDPTPAAGGGARLLAERGVDVAFAEDARPFERLNPGWLSRVALGRPRVIAKVGLSLDARVSLARDERSSMTGADGETVTRTLRGRVQAVVVGGATAAVDDPALTVRAPDGTPAADQPLRVLLAGEEPLRPDLRVFTDGVAPTLVLARDEATAARLPASVDTRVCATLHEAFAHLSTRGVDDVLCEPGPRLLGSLVREGLCDALVTVVAGGFGSAEGRTVWEGPATRDGSRLHPAFVPRESGIVGGVAATVWERTAIDRTQMREV